MLDIVYIGCLYIHNRINIIWSLVANWRVVKATKLEICWTPTRIAFIKKLYILFLFYKIFYFIFQISIKLYRPPLINCVCETMQMSKHPQIMEQRWKKWNKTKSSRNNLWISSHSTPCLLYINLMYLVTFFFWLII